MKHIILILFTVFLSPELYGQNDLTEKDILGTWTVIIPESRVKSMDMMFDGSTVTLKPDFSFLAKLPNEFSGTWQFQEGKIILDNEETPSPIILSELSKDSCIWIIEGVNARIPFYKMAKKASSNPIPENVKFVHVNREDLEGKWMNTHIEDTKKSNKQNIFLFGDSKTNDKLILSEKGQFNMYRTAIGRQGDRFLEGTWSIDGGVLEFKRKSGKIERLGITKFTQDSLILLDLENRFVPMCGETKIRFTYTKELAAGLKKYIIKPAVVDTFNSDPLKIALKVPEGFTDIYEIDGYTITTFQFVSCSWCGSAESYMATLKEDLLQNERFMRFIETGNEDMIIYEQKNLLGDDVWYYLTHAFTHNGEVFYIETGSFLEENVHVLCKSIEDMTIIND